uniref:Uncharacterized protein n=1 Tax=Strongyloides papillosus TaxID=174720 RepID=A0A0N5CC50_STREA
MEILNSQLADTLSKVVLKRIVEDNLYCAEFTGTKRTRILGSLLSSISMEQLSFVEELEKNSVKSLLHSAVNFLSPKKSSNLLSSFEHVSNLSDISGNLEVDTPRTFLQLGKYNEKSDPIGNFISDFEDLLIVHNIIADQKKKAALRSLLPCTLRDYL